jgi:hypothetical protein
LIFIASIDPSFLFYTYAISCVISRLPSASDNASTTRTSTHRKGLKSKDEEGAEAYCAPIRSFLDLFRAAFYLLRLIGISEISFLVMRLSKVPPGTIYIAGSEPGEGEIAGSLGW